MNQTETAIDMADINDLLEGSARWVTDRMERDMPAPLDDDMKTKLQSQLAIGNFGLAYYIAKEEGLKTPFVEAIQEAAEKVGLKLDSEQVEALCKDN